MICEKCGFQMIYKQTGRSCCYECTNCGYGWATSYFSPIDIDQTHYTITVKQMANINIEQIKVISKIFECNYIESRKILLNGNNKIAKAPVIKNTAGLLSKHNIEYIISPDFPYDIT